MNIPWAPSDAVKARNPALYGGVTAVSAAVEREAELHDEVRAYCVTMGYAFVHSRMDRATGQSPGVPDFIIAMPAGKTVWLELKSRKGKVSNSQIGWREHLRKLGHVWRLADNMPDVRGILNGTK